MQKRGMLVVLVLIVLISSNVYAQEDIYDDIGDVSLKESAGLTPDSPFYFLDGLVENILVGNNPEKALRYKEEKVVEARLMVEEGNVEAAKIAIQRAVKYSDIVEKEVSPDIEKRVRESSKAIKETFKELENELAGDEWDDVRVLVDEQDQREDRIALSAKISSQIKQLCESLSELNPVEYARVCRTGDDAPRWQRELDEELTKEQRLEAEEFFTIMSQCFKTAGKECRCEDISITAFADKCSIVAPLEAQCDAGDENACDLVDKETEDIEDLLPEYLIDVLDDLIDDLEGDQFDDHVPRECREVGATDQTSCMKVMFRIHAPEECVRALDDGRIELTSEREFDKACEKIMFESNAPQECIDAGLTDHRECGKLSFKLDAPQACLDAGLTGEGRNDWRECEAIRFDVEAPQACLDAGITGGDRDAWRKCDAIQFKTDAPQACLDAGIDPNDRSAWDKCQVIEFTSNAPPECLAAGLDGSGRDDWKECDKINFRNSADSECLDAGLTGDHVDDWRRCEELTYREEEHFDSGFRGPDCNAITDANEKLRCYEDFYNAAASGGERTFDPGKETTACFDGCFDECGDKRWECGQQGECLCFDDGGEFPPECGAVDCVQGYHCAKGGVCIPDDDQDHVDCSVIFCQEGYICQSDVGCVPDKSYDDDQGHVDCSVIFCQEGYICQQDVGCVPDSYDGSCEDGCSDECGQASWSCGPIGECVCGDYEEPQPVDECSDGCGQECGDRRWDCNSGYCQCYDDSPEPEPTPPPEVTPEPEPTPPPPEPDTTITGEVILDNDFLDYYYR